MLPILVVAKVLQLPQSALLPQLAQGAALCELQLFFRHAASLCYLLPREGGAVVETIPKGEDLRFDGRELVLEQILQAVGD